jgi:hypothetical protein
MVYPYHFFAALPLSLILSDFSSRFGFGFNPCLKVLPIAHGRQIVWSSLRGKLLNVREVKHDHEKE